MEALQRYAPLIESALRKLPLGHAPQNLYQPMDYLLQLGGKRIRPALALMACEAVGGQPEQALPQAMAVELFHNFSLMHDDIMDKAPLRRGQPTVHHRWDLNTAILSGDGMLILAYRELAQCSAELLPDLLNMFSQTALEVCEGQQMDMDFESRTDVLPAEYQAMIAFKTAVLLGCSVYLGARVGGSTPATARSLYQFGLDLGMAFQLRDDYLDTFGNPAETGKQPGGDILAGKKTWIYLHAQQQLNADEQVRWAADYAQATEADVPRWVAYFRKAGSDAAVLAESERYHQQALTALATSGLTTAQQAPFHALATWLLDRSH